MSLNTVSIIIKIKLANRKKKINKKKISVKTEKTEYSVCFHRLKEAFTIKKEAKLKYDWKIITNGL